METNHFKFSNRDQVYSIFSNYFKEGEHLIQETIEVTGYRTITVRIITIKDHTAQWKAMGLFTRGEQNGYNNGPLRPLVPFDKGMIKEFLQQSDLLASLTYQELIHIAIDTLNEIEKIGVHFANADVEMTIGELGDIWISDIDHCHPTHEMALVAGDPGLYYEILKTNMLYAKKLAGF